MTPWGTPPLRLNGPELPQHHSLEDAVRSDKTDFFIKNTESEDDGIYTCIAANEFGTVIQGAYLKVNSFSKW